MAKSKYPILLVHGMGFRDNKLLNYWGRIPKILKDNGYEVYYGNQDANGSIESNAQKLKNQIEELIQKYKIEKFNVIAHSKGGLEIRYAICNLKIENYIASVTTINTPHNGSKTIDKIMKLPKFLIKFFSKITDLWFRICGDKNPNTYQALLSFQTQKARDFNLKNIDSPLIYYQSYAFIMKKASSDFIMFIPYLVVKKIEGENDGFLTPDSVKWGNFKGVYTSTTNRGISHCDEVDFRRRKLSKKTPLNNYEISDMTNFYLDMVNDLVINHGF